MESVISLDQVSKTYKVKQQTDKPFWQRLLSTKTYRSIEAVKNISFQVGAGESVGLIGNNGAGKSTLVKMMTGILYPNSGDIKVLGRNPFDERTKNNQEIGVVFGQRTQLKWDLSPIESFKLLKTIYTIDDATYAQNMGLFVDLFDMKNFISQPVRTLSLGQRMKCEIVAAFLHNPSLVFLDEPSIGLDVFSKEAISDFLIEMERKKITIILTTHDLEEIERVCDRALVIDEGQLILEDRVDHLLQLYNREKNIAFTLKNREAVKIKTPQAFDISYAEYRIEVHKVPGEDIQLVTNQVMQENQIVDMSISGFNLTQIIKKYLEDRQNV